MKRLTLIVALICMAGGTAFTFDSVDRIGAAQNVFEDVMTAPDGGIPHELLATARCIVIVPGIRGAGMVFGDRYGLGMSMCRSETGWTAPSAVRIAGGDFSKQIFRGSTDLILLVMSDSAAHRLIRSPLILGAGGNVVAGPVGRFWLEDPETPWCANADIVYYGRSDGIYTDIALTGAVIEPVDEINRTVYGNNVRQSDILRGAIGVPPNAESLVTTVTRFSSEVSAY